MASSFVSFLDHLPCMKDCFTWQETHGHTIREHDIVGNIRNVPQDYLLTLATLTRMNVWDEKCRG